MCFFNQPQFCIINILLSFKKYCIKVLFRLKNNMEPSFCIQSFSFYKLLFLFLSVSLLLFYLYVDQFML